MIYRADRKQGWCSTKERAVCICLDQFYVKFGP